MSEDQRVEREPAPRRHATYPGNQHHLMTGDETQWLGPDRRGIVWRPCHTDYDPDTDKTRVNFAPVAPYEIDQVPGLRDRINLLQQRQAAAMGAIARIGEQA